jgi:hypothetical protein
MSNSSDTVKYKIVYANVGIDYWSHEIEENDKYDLIEKKINLLYKPILFNDAMLETYKNDKPYARQQQQQQQQPQLTRAQNRYIPPYEK